MTRRKKEVEDRTDRQTRSSEKPDGPGQVGHLFREGDREKNLQKKKESHIPSSKSGKKPNTGNTQ